MWEAGSEDIVDGVAEKVVGDTDKVVRCNGEEQFDEAKKNNGWRGENKTKGRECEGEIERRGRR